MTITEAETSPGDTELETTEPPAEETATDTSDADDDAPGGREAAKYRRRLRDTEAERDKLSSRLEGHQRREIERLVAAAGLQDGADLWKAGTKLADCLDDDGQVDDDKVKAAVSLAPKHWRKRRGTHDGGVRSEIDTEPPSLSGLVSRSKRR